MYSSHILPSRPFQPAPAATPLDIKHSSHKSLTAFLKACEKDGLLKLKDMKSDLVVMGVFPKHTDVISHHAYRTVKEMEEKRERTQERAEMERSKVKEMQVTELWKPHQQTVQFFAQTGNRYCSLC